MGINKCDGSGTRAQRIHRPCSYTNSRRYGVQINGGKPVFIPLDKKDFSIDWERVKDSLTNKTKLIILNSPHNPTGGVITLGDLRNLEEIIQDTNILILSDEVYEHIELKYSYPV